MKLSVPVISAALLSIADLVSGHCFIFEVTSPLDKDGEVVGTGLGYISDTHRHTHSLIDAVVFNKKNVHHGWWHGYQPTGCGVTASSHAIWVQKHNMPLWLHIAHKKLAWDFLKHEAPIDARINVGEYVKFHSKTGSKQDWVQHRVVKFGIPKVEPGTKINVGFFQVNADGAGDPSGRLKCMIDTKGDANQWDGELVVEADHLRGICPGNAHSVSHHHNRKCYLKVTMPEKLQCKGKHGDLENICIIRCQNTAANGPFGGCFAVQDVGEQPPEELPETTTTSTYTSTEGTKPTAMPYSKIHNFKKGNKHYRQRIIIKWKVIIVKAPGNGGKKPSNGGGKPSNGGVKPSNGGTKPSNGGGKPSNGGVKPSNGGTKPSNGGTKPSNGGTKPGNGGTKPGNGGTKPGNGGTKPAEPETEEEEMENPAEEETETPNNGNPGGKGADEEPEENAEEPAEPEQEQEGGNDDEYF
ncbi:hypothetical protein TWF718_005770 [Orbilia javanica]|uniref:Uncharacterized protein n=1 Tax=Orbilia javanica TaxID=47235 RepID=A0AAN8RDS9_9PEZI